MSCDLRHDPNTVVGCYISSLAWRQRQQEYQAALEAIHQQRQQLEQKHLEAEVRLIERSLQ